MNSFVLQRYWPVLLLLLGLRLVFWLGAFPNPDEAYYWLWGQHLDWSYFDHPPFHAWVQGLFTGWLGRSRFVLRLPNLISTALMIGLYWHICQQLYDRQARHAFWITVLLLLTSPLFFLFMAMAWHDHWLIWFGTASSYCLVRFLNSRRLEAYGWLYGAGVLLGLAGLCKYVALFLGIGFLVTIASRADWRSLVWNGHLYGAIAIALLVMTPVFWWNVQHEFYSFQFYLGRSVQAESRTVHWVGPIGFLLLSGLILGPVHVGLILKTALKGPMTRFGMTYQRVAFTLFGTSTGLLALLSLKAPVLYYWNILAYPLLFPLLAGVFLNLHRLNELRHPKLLNGAIAMGSLAALLLVVHYTVLPLSALIDDAGDEDTRMLYGWPKIADVVTQTAAPLAEPPLLLTTDYRSASALAYALNDASVMSISGRIDQFDFWYDTTQLDGRDGVLLGDRWHPICPVHRSMFEQTTPASRISVERLGGFIKTYELISGNTFGINSGSSDPLSTDYPLAFTSDGERCAPP